jgi:hypothetical protein
MERIDLDRLRQTLDAHCCLPRRLAEPEGCLDVRDFPREECRGDFRERLRAVGSEAESRVGGHCDVPAHRLRFGDFDPWQRPFGSAKRLIALETKLNHLPA